MMPFVGLETELRVFVLSCIRFHPRTPQPEDMQSEDDHATPLATEDNISVYSGAGDNEPHCITQEDMNDLSRDLYLSKQQSELLASLKP